MERYKFLIDWTDTESPFHKFESGTVVRMAEGQAAELIAAGIMARVADFTPCRIDPLAANSCTEITAEMKTAYEQANTSTINKQTKK